MGLPGARSRPGGTDQAGLLLKLTNCEIVAGTLSDLGPDQQFDGIFYMDVLEHIEADGAELARAAGHLKPNGVLAILSPALPWLFTPFDKAIGHYRRYTKNSLAFDRAARFAGDKMYISGLGRTFGVAGK